jgi:hypothetical protein
MGETKTVARCCKNIENAVEHQLALHAHPELTPSCAAARVKLCCVPTAAKANRSSVFCKGTVGSPIQFIRWPYEGMWYFAPYPWVLPLLNEGDATGP